MSSLPFVTRSKDGVLVEAFVEPRASRDAIEGIHGEALKVKVKAPPVDRANRAVESLLADLLDIPGSNVAVVGGLSSRRKRIALTEVSRQQVVKRRNRVLSPPDS